MNWRRFDEYHLASLCGRYTVTRNPDPLEPTKFIYGAWKRPPANIKGWPQMFPVNLGQRLSTANEAKDLCESDQMDDKRLEPVAKLG